MEMFGDKFGFNIIKVDVEECFLKVLEGIDEFEVKCKIIGCVFVEVFDEELKKFSNVKWLV